MVVASAPALFEIPCGDVDCQDGGHDLTREVMWSLRSREKDMAGASNCSGGVRSRQCDRHITYHLRAEYT